MERVISLLGDKLAPEEFNLVADHLMLVSDYAHAECKVESGAPKFQNVLLALTF